MKKILLILALLISFNTYSKNIYVGNEKYVQGIIVSDKTMQRIPNASINCNDKITYADENGKFTIKLSQVVDLTLIVDFVEYKNFDYKIFEVNNITLLILTFKKIHVMDSDQPISL